MPRPSRWHVLAEIERLDPERDHQRIVHAYEREHCHFAASNQRVGSATRDLFASWFPAVLTPLVRYAIYAMFDDETIAAFGFPRPLPLTRPLLRGALKLRGGVVRWLPPRREPHFFTDSPNRTHPDGYRIAELGPKRWSTRSGDARPRRPIDEYPTPHVTVPGADSRSRRCRRRMRRSIG